MPSLRFSIATLTPLARLSLRHSLTQRIQKPAHCLRYQRVIAAPAWHGWTLTMLLLGLDCIHSQVQAAHTSAHAELDPGHRGVAGPGHIASPLQIFANKSANPPLTSPLTPSNPLYAPQTHPRRSSKPFRYPHSQQNAHARPDPVCGASRGIPTGA
jgi:hypothetical protein